MDEITITLNRQHLQIIRAALGQLKYDAAEPVISHIGEQVQKAQIAPTPPAPENDEATTPQE